MILNVYSYDEQKDKEYLIEVGIFKAEKLAAFHPRAEKKFGRIDITGDEEEETWDCLDVAYNNIKLEEVKAFILLNI